VEDVERRDTLGLEKLERACPTESMERSVGKRAKAPRDAVVIGGAGERGAVSGGAEVSIDSDSAS